MTANDRAKASSTTEHIHTSGPNVEPSTPPSKHTQSFKRPAPHGTYSMPGAIIYAELKRNWETVKDGKERY